MWFDGTTKELKGDNLLCVADALEVEALWLAEGRGPKKKAESFRRINIADPADESLAQVRRMQFMVSAGITGFTVEPIEDERPPIYFRKDWCAKNNYDPDKLIAILVNGDSMVPSLYHGDLVVINTADKQPRDGEVFAVNNEGEPVIKRLRRDGADWWLDSDAADQLRFRPRRCGEGCSMIGRVIYKQSERI